MSFADDRTVRRGRHRFKAWLGLTVGLSLATVPPVLWSVTRAPAAVGIVPAVAVSDQRGPAIHVPAPSRPSIPVHPARLADLRWGATPAPVRIRIAAIRVNAPVSPVGVDTATGLVRVPASVRTVGWYRFGPSPGQAGSAVLIGHVDSATQGAGSLFRLREVRPGNTVAVVFADGSTRWFRIVGRRLYAKGDLPSRIFARWGSPLLTLVTCGGPFDSRTNRYEDNVVVFAVPRQR